MKLIKQNIRLIALVLSLLLLSLVVYGSYSVLNFGSRWFSSSANTSLRQIKQNVAAGTIYDRNNIALAASASDGKRHYHPDELIRKANVHAVGDPLNNVAYGAESFMANYLYAFNESYLERLLQAFTGTKRKGNDIRLTLDSSLAGKAYKLFPKGRSGAVIVMNYKTGELLTLQSYPSFDPMDLKPEDKNNPLKPFWNRATKWVSAPGSTFKIITLAAALANGKSLESDLYECAGVLPVGNTVVTDAGNAAHGKINLKQALELSCNIVFAQVALELGDQKLKETAASFGMGDYFLFSDLVVENSVYPLTNRTDKEVAWSGPGQSSLLATPLHMAMVVAAIANDGVMMEPKLLLNVRSAAGESRFAFVAREYRRAVSAQVAEDITQAMRGAVRRGTAVRAAVGNVAVAGKTGSAQTDNAEETTAWFVGFIDDAAHPYAFCVVVEDAGGGGSVAAPIAAALIRHLTGR